MYKIFSPFFQARIHPHQSTHKSPLLSIAIDLLLVFYPAEEVGKQQSSVLFTAIVGSRWLLSEFIACLGSERHFKAARLQSDQKE